MIKKQKLIIFVSGFFIGIFSNWIVAYAPNTFLGINIFLYITLVSLIGSVVFGCFKTINPVNGALLISFGITFACLLRIMYDISFIDKSMHNLLPFELAINFGLSFVGSLIGLYFIKIFKK